MQPQFYCISSFKRRGARVVMEQIANLSTGNCRQGSSPCLSARNILTIDNHSGCSVARLSRHVWDVEAAGSNPATPTKSRLMFQTAFFIYKNIDCYLYTFYKTLEINHKYKLQWARYAIVQY